MATFGELLAELRQDRHLTQEQLGKEIYVTAGTISNYENDVHFPDVEKLIGIPPVSRHIRQTGRCGYDSGKTDRNGDEPIP